MIPSLLEVVHVTHEISLTLHDSIVYPYLNTKSLVTSNTFQSFTMLSIPDIANMTKATSGTASMIPPHGTMMMGDDDSNRRYDDGRHDNGDVRHAEGRHDDGRHDKGDRRHEENGQQSAAYSAEIPAVVITCECYWNRRRRSRWETIFICVPCYVRRRCRFRCRGGEKLI
jgi:hypothetical protein